MGELRKEKRRGEKRAESGEKGERMSERSKK
jgi:hypothetical protein